MAYNVAPERWREERVFGYNQARIKEGDTVEAVRDVHAGTEQIQNCLKHSLI